MWSTITSWAKQPFPFDLLYWNSDTTRMPPANHSFYLREFYQNNRLAKGEMSLGGIKLDLSKITLPVYELATREDHIAPAKSVFKGAKLFSGPVRFVLAGSGHIAGVVNPPASGKYMHWVPSEGAAAANLEEWLASDKGSCRVVVARLWRMAGRAVRSDGSGLHSRTRDE